VDPCGRPDVDPVGAELFEHAVVGAFRQQMQIEVRQHPSVSVRIVDLEDVTSVIQDPQPIIARIVDVRLEHAGAGRGHRHDAIAGQANLHRSRGRMDGADDESAGRGGMRAQICEWITVEARDRMLGGFDHLVIWLSGHLMWSLKCPDNQVNRCHNSFLDRGGLDVVQLRKVRQEELVALR
jgi:hypothetical protein